MPSTRLVTDSRPWRTLQLLKDGEWHSLTQIAALIADRVRPEIAHRETLRTQGCTGPMDEASVARGLRKLVPELIYQMKRQGYIIEAQGTDGKRAYRLIGSSDGQRMAINDAAALTLPELTPPEYALLKADIEKHGLVYPIVIDEDGQVIDGKHRKRAWDELVADGRVMGNCPAITKLGLTPEEKEELGVALNLYRRQLGAERRQRLVAWLKMQGWSTRRIAKAAGVSKSTVQRDSADPESVPNGTDEENTPAAPAQEPTPEPPALSPVQSGTDEPVEPSTPETPVKPPAQPKPQSPEPPPSEHHEPKAESQNASEPTNEGTPNPARTTVTCPHCGQSFEV